MLQKTKLRDPAYVGEDTVAFAVVYALDRRKNAVSDAVTITARSLYGIIKNLG